MKLPIFLSIFLILGVTVESQTKKKWRPIPVDSMSAIHATRLAAQELNVESLATLKAWKNIKGPQIYEEIRVLFKARCQYGVLKLCQADVTFSGLLFISNASCWEADPNAY